jgi:hypothetical protein
MRQAISVQSALDRVADAKFAIDRLESLNATTPPPHETQGPSSISKHLAIGPATASARTRRWRSPARGRAARRRQRYRPRAARACRDDRVSAVIAMSPERATDAQQPRRHLRGREGPGLLHDRTKDDSPVSATKAPRRRIPFDHHAQQRGGYPAHR